MIEVRFHGRGGQGAVTSAELMAQAAIAEGRYAQAFPSFGPERRGAPLMAFLRISDRTHPTAGERFTSRIWWWFWTPPFLATANVKQGLKDGGTSGGQQLQAHIGRAGRMRISTAALPWWTPPK